MKLSSIVLLLFSITTLNSCMKESISTSNEETIVSTSSEEIIIGNAPSTMLGAVWMNYDETYCADPWGESSAEEQDKLTNIVIYFNDLGVQIIEIEVIDENEPEDCFSCGCKSGFVIKCKISEEDVSVLIDEGFYQ